MSDIGATRAGQATGSKTRARPRAPTSNAPPSLAVRTTRRARAPACGAQCRPALGAAHGRKDSASCSRVGAGKGGTTGNHRTCESAVFRVVALPAPTEREKSQMYAQRYIPHLPAADEIVIFLIAAGTTAQG